MEKNVYLLPIIRSFIAIILLNGCQQHKELQPGEGFIDVDGGKVWYRIVGSGEKTPVIVLHGGPGAPSYYLKPLSPLGADRKLIFYDQLGCGKSDHSVDTTKMTVDHFVDELKTVVDHFGLKEFYLYGQSWGTMLGTDYYLKYPLGIKAIILSSPAISIPRWLSDADTLLSTLPDSIQNAVRTNELNKTYDSPAYQNAIQVYYQNFLARKLPWSADIDSTFMQLGKSYQYMWGPSEFTAEGALKTYDRTNRLGEIKVPTLFMAGEFDEARPTTVQYYQSLVPGAKFEIIKGAGHLTMQDKPEENNKVIIDFLNGLEKK
ncbi:MAG TPA: proline iminopeptidase-family hydrolase [Chitinophagaceae bacterium]|jgi:proline iminopeptidase|nr:proline iminopeptidase-family hydrolase [Chitinophagaceae bacterium]